MRTVHQRSHGPAGKLRARGVDRTRVRRGPGVGELPRRCRVDDCTPRCPLPQAHPDRRRRRASCYRGPPCTVVGCTRAPRSSRTECSPPRRKGSSYGSRVPLGRRSRARSPDPVARSRASDLLTEDRRVVGVRRVDRADHEPVGTGVDVLLQRVGHVQDRRRSRPVRAEPAGLGVGRGVGVREHHQPAPRHHERRTHGGFPHLGGPCPERLDACAPPVPPVGVGGDGTHRARAPTDPRDTAVARGDDQGAKGVDSLRLGAEGQAEALVLSRLWWSPAPTVTRRRSRPRIRSTVSNPARAWPAGAGSRATNEPTAMRDVSAATAPSIANISIAGRRVPSTVLRNRWS